MDTENLSIPSENGGTDNKSEKKAKAKKIAGKAAQFAGAAGLGVAGAMAANAMTTPEDNDSLQPADIDEEASDAASTEGAVEGHTGGHAAFDPNDIMIEDVDELLSDEDDEFINELEPDDVDIVAVDEPEPITGDPLVEPSGDVAMIDVDDIIIEPGDNTQSDSIEMAEDVYGDPYGTDQIDNPEPLLSDNDTESGEPDIMNDILS